MRLRKLRLQSYRIHQDSTLDCGDASLVIVRGRNMSGKSSFAEALSMNLANTTVSLSADGKGFTKKIRTINGVCDGKAVITAEIQGNHLLKNIVTMNVNTSGRTPDTECLDVENEQEAKEVVGKFKRFLADRKPALLVATQTDYFAKLDEEKQTNLMAKLVLPGHHDFPKDKIDATNSYLETPINFDGEPFDVIKSAHKGLYHDRETTNRQVKEFTIPDALPIVKGVDSASLQTQLTTIREQRTKLQTERDAAMQKATEVEVKRGRLQTKIEGLRAELDRGKKHLSEIESRILSDKQVKHLTEVAAKKDELDALRKQHSAWRDVMSRLDEQVGKLNGLLGEDRTDEKSVCPMCEQDIDAIKIGAMIADLKKEIADADQELQKLDTKIEAIGDVGAAKETLRKHNEAVKESDELEASLAEIVKAGKATRADLEALGEAINATAPFVQPLADLQAKEDKINEQLRPVIAAEERATERARLTKQKEGMQKRAATLDTLVKYFDKDGIKAELIGKYIGGFESKINSVLEAFGYKTSLSMEPFSFEVTTSRGYVGPVKELSGAEEHIFKCAFQCAVSIAAGINLVVIDEIEEIGEDIRNNLFQVVYKMLTDKILDQAIMIGFSLDRKLPVPQAPNSAYFYVEEGSVARL